MTDDANPFEGYGNFRVPECCIIRVLMPDGTVFPPYPVEENNET